MHSEVKLTEPAIMVVHLARRAAMADRAVILAGCWPGSELPHIYPCLMCKLIAFWIYILPLPQPALFPSPSSIFEQETVTESVHVWLNKSPL